MLECSLKKGTFLCFQDSDIAPNNTNCALGGLGVSALRACGWSCAIDWKRIQAAQKHSALIIWTFA